jgi:phosphatidylglycerophosphate synthase
VDLSSAAAPSATAAASLLVIFPGAPRTGAAVPPHIGLAGVPLLRRIVLAAVRAGFEHIRIAGNPGDARALLAGTPARFLADAAAAPLDSGRLVFLAGNVVPQPAGLQRLRELALQPGQLYSDSASVALLATDEMPRLLGMAARSADLPAALARLGPAMPLAAAGDDGSGRFVLGTPKDVPAAERWLLRGLIKAHEGFMSRHLERRLSLAVTRRLCVTGITPNAMSLISIGVGLLGALFFLSPAPGWQLTGALLFLAHSILDGCDGELARLKFRESAAGARLDVAGDNIVHSAVFTGMAIGWSLQAQAAWPLLLGALTVASTLATAVIVYRRGMRASTERTATSLSRVADALVHRDFIYGIVVLAALGRAWWFLVLAAVGTPLFLIVLLGMRASRPAPAP